MKLEKIRLHRKRIRWVEGLFFRNPVLVSGLALPFAVMATNNLKSSVSISILLACSMIPTVLLASLIGDRLPAWSATIVYTVFSMGLIMGSVPLTLPIFPEVADSLGIYVPILAINTILLTLCERHSRQNHRPMLALADALSYSAGFALIVCIVAALREYFGNNTLWGIAVAAPAKAAGLQIAFSGFILIAFFSALLRFLHRTALSFAYRRANPRDDGNAPAGGRL